MSQISRKNSFGKWFSHFLVGNLMSRDGNCFFFFVLFCFVLFFFGCHLVIVYPIFDFFFFFFLLYFGSFGLLYQWPAFHRQFHSVKYFFWVRVHRDPPWPLTGVQKALTTSVLKVLSHIFQKSFFFLNFVSFKKLSLQRYEFNISLHNIWFLENKELNKYLSQFCFVFFSFFEF